MKSPFGAISAYFQGRTISFRGYLCKYMSVIHNNYSPYIIFLFSKKMIIDYLISSAQQPCFGLTNMPRRHRTSRNQIEQSKSDETCELSSNSFPPQQKTNRTWKKDNDEISGPLFSNRRRAQVFVYACYSLRWSGAGGKNMGKVT